MLILLAQYRHRWFRRVAVVLCVAVSFVLSNQVYVTLTDRVEHALELRHAPTPLAGALIHDEGAHDHHGHHGHDDDGQAPADALDHKHIDTSMVYLVLTAPVFVGTTKTSFVRVAVPQGLDWAFRYRLERPPRNSLATSI